MLLKLKEWQFQCELVLNQVLAGHQRPWVCALDVPVQTTHLERPQNDLSVWKSNRTLRCFQSRCPLLNKICCADMGTTHRVVTWVEVDSVSWVSMIVEMQLLEKQYTKGQAWLLLWSYSIVWVDTKSDQCKPNKNLRHNQHEVLTHHGMRLRLPSSVLMQKIETNCCQGFPYFDIFYVSPMHWHQDGALSTPIGFKSTKT